MYYQDGEGLTPRRDLIKRTWMILNGKHASTSQRGVQMEGKKLQSVV